MTFLDLAEEVLEKSAQPLSAKDIWHEAQKQGLLHHLTTKGKTPWATLGAQLYTDSKKESSRFVPTGKRPVMFSLKHSPKRMIKLPSLSMNPASTSIADDTRDLATSTVVASNGYKEHDLHPLLVYFAKRELNCYCKTINHTKSQKNNFGEWVHPDIVGCSFPIGQWDDELLQLSSAVENTSVRFLSFELKKELNMGKLREYFFQAVSNSSWANESYLVAADIDDKADFITELSRLSTSFGIGVIKLDIQDPDKSSILFPAKTRDNLDWETVDKLTKMNPDFKEFVKRVRIDVNSNEIRKELYDKVLDKKKLTLGFH